MKIKRRKKRDPEEKPVRLTSPCRECERIERDKRRGACKTCDKHFEYAAAVERIYSHLPPGIDCGEIHCSNNGTVKYLTEVKGI